LLSFGEDGHPGRVVDLAPRHFDGLAVGPDGTFAVLSLHLRRVEILDAAGNLVQVVKLPVHLGPVRNIGFTGAGELEAVNAHGERFNTGRPGAMRPVRAMLLDRKRGPVGSESACGIRVEEGRAFLYLWRDTDGPSTSRGSRPDVVPLDLGRVVAARPVTPCSKEGMLLEVEHTSEDGLTQIAREVAFIKNGRVETAWSLEAPQTYVPFGRFACRGSDAVMMLPAREGLQVWHWKLR
jgi:hypothetical protein